MVAEVRRAGTQSMEESCRDGVRSAGDRTWVCLEWRGEEAQAWAVRWAAWKKVRRKLRGARRLNVLALCGSYAMAKVAERSRGSPATTTGTSHDARFTDALHLRRQPSLAPHSLRHASLLAALIHQTQTSTATSDRRTLCQRGRQIDIHAAPPDHDDARSASVPALDCIHTRYR